MKHVFTFLLIMLLLIIASSQLFRSSPQQLMEPQEGQSNLRFIQNNGQWDAPIRYKAPLIGGDIFLEDNRMVYSFCETPKHLHHHGDPRYFGQKLQNNISAHTDQQTGVGLVRQASPEILKGHVLQVYWEGANPNPEFETGMRQQEYYNYFLGDDPQYWAGEVPLFALLRYKNLYPGTDLRFYGIGESLKYDFILEPGADPSRIRIRYEGAEAIRLNDGNLEVKTTIRDVVEYAPFAYQIIDDKRIQVACHYQLEGNLVTYSFPEGYDARHELVIDPTLEFSTFTGSSVDNWGFTATYDTAGNLYAGGILWSSIAGTGGYPTTPGAYQTTSNGGSFEITLTKFNATGTGVVYSTLLGGSLDDRPHSLVVNTQNELYVYGRTNSNNFPTTTGAFDTTHNGGYDIYVSRFNATGSILLGSTYIGGTLDEAVNENGGFGLGTSLKYNYGDDARGEIILDDNGDCYVASCTRSTNFPATAGAFQTLSGGQQDGCIIKLDASLNNLTWASYLGGSLMDAAYAMQVDPAGIVYATGGTNSLNFPGAAGGLNNSNQGGRTDGFISKIAANGSNILQSTYIGTSAYDQTYLIQLDADLDVYVVGQTESNTYPVVNSPYVDAGAKQFITKLNNDLDSIVYSTTYGSLGSAFPNISPTAFLVDVCEHVYVTGWGGITNSSRGFTTGMPISADAYQSASDGSDLHLFVLERDADSMLYGSYIGGNNPAGFSGEHVDGGTSRFDKNGIVYHAVCANCGGSPTPITGPQSVDARSFPSTPGVWSTTNGATNCNLAAFKMSFNLTGLSANFAPLDSNNVPLVGGLTRGCPPLTVNFDNTSFNGPSTLYQWDLGVPGGTSTAFEPSFVYTTPGTYQIRLVIIDSTVCNITDTAYQTIVVFPPAVVDAGPNLSICPGDSIALLGSGFGSFSWSPALTLSNDTISKPTAFPAITTQYFLALTDTNGCEVFDSVTVAVDTLGWLMTLPDTSVCENGTLTLATTAPPGSQFNWSPPATLNSPIIDSPDASPDSTTTYYVTATNSIGCALSDSVTVVIYTSEVWGDTVVCPGAPASLFASGGASYQWSPQGSLNFPNSPTPIATTSATTTYSVRITHVNGCIDSGEVRVNVFQLTDPNAGSPDTLCPGGEARLVSSGGVTYAWSPPASLDRPNDPDPIANPTATTTYTVTIIDNNGCENSDQVTITVYPWPPVDAGPDQELCEGDTYQINATGANSYTWEPSQTLSSLSIPNPIATPRDMRTRYIVTGTDDIGCTATDSFWIDIVQRPVTMVTEEHELCDPNGNYQLFAAGGERVVWNTGFTERNLDFAPTTPTPLYVTAYNGDCAGNTDSIALDPFYNIPTAAFTATPRSGFVPQPVQFTNMSTGATTYDWMFGNSGITNHRENPEFTFAHADPYTVTLVAYSDFGCPDTATLDFDFENVVLFTPNAFTPNADAYNDFFYVQHYGIRDFHVQIFSRWGMLIYESFDRDFQWDGTYKGTQVPEGVYVFVIYATGENEVDYTRTGTVTVFR